MIDHHDQYSLMLHITSEEYEADNVTVTVEWTQHYLGAVYNVAVVPSVPILLNGTVGCRLTISYNTEYNLSVEATDLCGVSAANSPAYIGLRYG